MQPKARLLVREKKGLLTAILRATERMAIARSTLQTLRTKRFNRPSYKSLWKSRLYGKIMHVWSKSLELLSLEFKSPTTCQHRAFCGSVLLDCRCHNIYSNQPTATQVDSTCRRSANAESANTSIPMKSSWMPCVIEMTTKRRFAGLWEAALFDSIHIVLTDQHSQNAVQTLWICWTLRRREEEELDSSKKKRIWRTLFAKIWICNRPACGCDSSVTRLVNLPSKSLLSYMLKE